MVEPRARVRSMSWIFLNCTISPTVPLEALKYTLNLPEEASLASAFLMPLILVHPFTVRVPMAIAVAGVVLKVVKPCGVVPYGTLISAKDKYLCPAIAVKFISMRADVVASATVNEPTLFATDNVP